MADMNFKANLLPNTDFGYSLGSEETNNIKRWEIHGKLYKYCNSDDLDPMISYRANNKDICLYQIGHATSSSGSMANSYRVIYKGSGSSPNNYFQLIANTSSTDTIAVQINENGDITCTNTVNADISGNAATATKLGTADKGSATKPIYLAAGVPTECTTYAGGTAVTLNGTSKAGSTASFYAPTAAGTADTQALVSKGANTAPAWTNISPGITITDGTASAAPKVNVTVLGRSGTAQSITTASTSVYGCTKLTSSYTSTDSTLAATGAAIAAAIGTLDVAAVGGGTGEYISKIQETDGKISATKSTTSVSNAWTAGTTAGPTIKTTVNGIAGSEVAIPTATASASGVVTTGAQTWSGNKTFKGSISINTDTTIAADTPSVIYFKPHQTDNDLTYTGAYIAVHDDLDTANNGSIMVIRSGGKMIIGAGESPANAYNELKGNDYEYMYITSDQDIHFWPGCNTFANHNQAVLYASGEFRNYRSATGTFLHWYTGSTDVGYVRLQTIGTTSTVGWVDIILGNNLADNVANNERGRVYLGCNGGWTNFTGETGSLGGTNRHYVNFGYIKATQAWGAVWNDYAEFRETKEKIEPGRCICEIGDDTLRLTSKRLERGCEIVSDTYGFAIGESEKAKTPTAASGRVLAYLYEDREIAKQHIGDPVCSGPNGTVSIMTEEEEMKYPSRIIGTISAVPDYEVWHAGSKEFLEEIKVNGRIWIRIR